MPLDRCHGWEPARQVGNGRDLPGGRIEAALNVDDDERLSHHPT
jgi:hypothetical protein